MERAKFYSKNDLSNGMQLLRAEKVLDGYQENRKYSDINEVLELYNVKTILDNGLELKSWSEEQISNYKQKVKGLGKDIVVFFRSAEIEIAELVRNVDFAYGIDFWNVIESYDLLDMLTDTILSAILRDAPDQIEYILYCKNIVKEHDAFIGSFLQDYPKATSILLHRYLIIGKDTDARKIFLPQSLTNHQKQQIVEDCLKSGKATLEEVRIIMQAKDVQDFSLTPDIKLLAKKLERQLSVVPEDAIVSTYQTGFTIEFCKEKNIPPKQAWLNGLIIHYIYSEEYLDSVDEISLLDIFVSCFEYFDDHGLLRLCYNRSEGDILERTSLEEIKGFYTINNLFRLKNNIAVSQLAMFDNYLRRKGKTIEYVINSYYEQHFSQAYAYPSVALNFAKDDETYINKNKVIAPEMESVVKQYNLFVEKGEIDPELFHMSMSLPLSMSKSLLWERHKYVVWGNKRQDAFKPMYLLFSDQSLLSFVEPFKDKHYPTLYSLLTHESSVEYDKYGSHQRPSIDYLVEYGLLVVDNGFVYLSNSPRIEVLFQMYSKGEISYYYHEPRVRAEIDLMVKDKILSYDDYLLSPQERHYINFFMNNSEYSNGLQLRNKYSHGAKSYLNSDEEHKNEYYYFLMIFVIILLKMDEDMKLSMYLNNAVANKSDMHPISNK